MADSGFSMPVPADGAMLHKALKVRPELVLGLVVVAASIIVAIWMHRTVTDISRSCLMPPCPNQWTFGYPVVDRLAVVAAGFLVAGLIIAVGAFTRRHASAGRAGHGQSV